MTSMKSYKFCFDLDGTICTSKKDGERYEDMTPLPGALETLNHLKDAGHYIIIYTARNMVTHNYNVGKVIAKQAPIVIDWLRKYNVPYDELHFGKPLADFYVDDKGINMSSWDNFNNKLKEIMK